MLTKEQAEWTGRFINMDPQVLTSGAGTGAAPGAHAASAAAPAQQTLGLSLPTLPSLPDIPDPTITVHVKLSNKTSHDLELVSTKLENPHGSEFKAQPPTTIAANSDDASFVIGNNKPFLTGVGGEVTYRLADEAGTSATFKWERGRVPDRTATVTMSPDDSKRFEKVGDFKGDDFSFVLRGKGQDDPSGGGGGGATGTLLSCRVTVQNKSNQTIFLRKQDNAAGGDFVNNPADQVPPGGQCDFIYSETAGGKNHNCRGTMAWDIGDPKAGHWSMMWDNQRGAKNLSASFLDPDDGSFHTLDQIDNGDENVPVRFVLSGAGGGGKKPVTGTTCTISVTNNTDQVLTQKDLTENKGKAQTQPPATLAPGASGQFVFVSNPSAPDEGVDGGVTWFIGDNKDPESATTWDLAWQKPVTDAGAAEADTVGGKAGDFKSDAKAADGNDGSSTMTFTLSGGGGPTPNKASTTCNITVVNNTDQLLTRDAALENKGQLQTQPPVTMAPGASAQFVYVNSPDDPDAGADGAVIWIIGDGKDAAKATSWTISWQKPGGGACTTSDLVFGDAEKNFKSDGKATDGPDGTCAATFTLSGSGGQPGKSSTTCDITITNSTDQLLTRDTAVEDHGQFQTQPPSTLAPGASCHVVYVNSPEAPDLGAQGAILWSVGGGPDANQTTQWVTRWAKPASGAGTANGDLLGDRAKNFKSDAKATDGKDGAATMTYTLSGGTGPQPQTAKTFTVSVNNQSKTDLKAVGAGGSGGKLKANPPSTLAAGASATLEYVVDDPGKGGSGVISWSAGDPAAASWNNNWQIAADGSATVTDKVDPADSGLASSSTSVTNGNEVVMTFTMTGELKVTPDEPDDAFAPPPKSKQPTLRKGDESPDGWVEYGQRLLNKWLKDRGQPQKKVDGVFSGGMDADVRAFQSDRKCLVDGVIGNETWSMLRESQTKDAVGTDGRKPHTFEQKDAQARFVTERPDSTGYNPADDSWFIRIVDTGEQPIDKFKMTVKVTQPSGDSHTHAVPIKGDISPSGDGQGNFVVVTIKNFKRRFKLDADKKNPVDPLTCTADAYLDQAIGGDAWSGPISLRKD